MVFSALFTDGRPGKYYKQKKNKHTHTITHLCLGLGSKLKDLIIYISYFKPNKCGISATPVASVKW